MFYKPFILLGNSGQHLQGVELAANIHGDVGRISAEMDKVRIFLVESIVELILLLA